MSFVPFLFQQGIQHCEQLTMIEPDTAASRAAVNLDIFSN
jgi:hypothetical protein